MSDVYPPLIDVRLLFVSLPWNINNPRAGISSGLCIVISLVPWIAASILWILRKHMDERTNFIWLKEQTGFGEHPASGLFYHHGQDQFHCQQCWPHLFASKSSGMKFIRVEIPAPWKQQEATVAWGLCDVGSRNSTLDSETLRSYHSPVRSSPMQTVLSFP